MSATVSAPITAIEIGDTLITGSGTETVETHTVTEITKSYDYGCVITIKCDDGYRVSDTPNGFWYQITKADPAAQAAAEASARAFATAWDNKR